MGLETEADFGGAESSFTGAILVVEGKQSSLCGGFRWHFHILSELAKIDPSISALCDIHVSISLSQWGHV